MVDVGDKGVVIPTSNGYVFVPSSGAEVSDDVVLIPSNTGFVAIKPGTVGIGDDVVLIPTYEGYIAVKGSLVAGYGRVFTEDFSTDFSQWTQTWNGQYISSDVCYLPPDVNSLITSGDVNAQNITLLIRCRWTNPGLSNPVFTLYGSNDAVSLRAISTTQGRLDYDTFNVTAGDWHVYKITVVFDPEDTYNDTMNLYVDDSETPAVTRIDRLGMPWNLELKHETTFSSGTGMEIDYIYVDGELQ